MSTQEKFLIAPLLLVLGFILAKNLFWLALDVVLWILEKIDGDVQQPEHDDVPKVQAVGLPVGLPRTRGKRVQESDALSGRS